jgi:serine/threonine protein kinase
VGELSIDATVASRWRIVRKLGEGGMSLIFEVQHVKLKKSFAMKALLPALLDNEEAMVRFDREAELLASLRHPNIVEITDWDVLPDGLPFMILEYLHGAPLRVRLDRGPMPWAAIARIGDQVLSALSLAHRIGITHRDLKPENIFIAIDDAGEERVKLLDFGVSKLRSLATRTTGVHEMLGTPSYMSPEQAQGQGDQVGPSTDVWAMGVVLYEMATARVAYTGESLVQTVQNIATARPTPMTQFRPDAPPEFVDLVDRATSIDDERRIQTADELRVLLRAALAAPAVVTPHGVSAIARPAIQPQATPLPGTPAPTTLAPTTPAEQPADSEPDKPKRFWPFGKRR